MPDIVKLVGSEISLSTANTVSLATVVRIYNNSTVSVLTVKNAAATQLGNTTIIAGGLIYLSKQSTDTITSSVAVLATPVAYTN